MSASLDSMQQESRRQLMNCALETARAHTSCSLLPMAQTSLFKMLSSLQSNFQVSSLATFASSSSNTSFKAGALTRAA